MGLPAVTLIAAVPDNPATDIWAGGPVLLVPMSISIGLASLELWRREPSYSHMRIPMATAAGSLAVFYFFRFLAFIVQGRNGPIFVTAFGSAATALVTMIVLVVVSFSMAALSSDQQTRTLLVGLPR